MGERVILQLVSELRGDNPPEVPLADGVNLEALGENPMFVTLRIGKIGAKSDKGFTYGEQAVRDIVNHVNRNKTEGRWGHLPNEERHTKYEPPSLRWVGAVLDGDGTAWGKALVLDEPTSDYYRVAEATSAPVGTSLYGVLTLTKDRKHVLKVDLESIDIADPSRLGVGEVVGTPVITAEMIEQEGNVPTIEEQLQAAIEESSGLRERISEMETAQEGLQADHQAIEGIRAVIGEYAESMVHMGITINASGPDLRQVIGEMIERLQSMQAADFIRTAEQTVGEMVTLEDLRPLVMEMLQLPTPEQLSDRVVIAEMVKRGKGKPETFKTVIGEQITRILESPSVKVVAGALVTKAGGPEVVVGEQAKPEDWRDKAAREAKDVARSVGVV